MANDFGFINTTNGNISILNDFATGNINFSAGAGGTAQMTLEADGDLFLTGKLGVGLTPVQKVDIRQDQNASTRVNISNQSTGTAAWAGISAGNSTGGGSLYKLSSGYTTYKTQAANDLGFINTVSGNISILNDWATGHILLTSGASTTPHFQVRSNGRIAIGNMTPNYLLDATSTDAYGLPRGTVAQRPAIVTSTTPMRFNTDSTALEYGESVGVWRLLATRAYARSLVAGSTWLKPQLEAGSVTINAASNADLFINNLDSVKFGKTLIRSSNNGLLILNPDVGASGIATFGAGYHTVINGAVAGTDGGTGHIVIGGTVTANTTGTTFAMALGYSSNVSTAYGLGVGYNADVTADNGAAFGRNALADETGEMSLGSSIYSKINLWTNTGDIYAKGDVIAEDSVKVTTRPSMPAATDVAVYDASGWLGYRSASSLQDGNGLISDLPNGDITIDADSNSLTFNNLTKLSVNQTDVFELAAEQGKIVDIPSNKITGSDVVLRYGLGDNELSGYFGSRIQRATGISARVKNVLYGNWIRYDADLDEEYSYETSLESYQDTLGVNWTGATVRFGQDNIHYEGISSGGTSSSVAGPSISTPSWLVQSQYAGDSRMNWLKVDLNENDSTAHAVSIYEKYSLPNETPDQNKSTAIGSKNSIAIIMCFITLFL